MSRVENGVCQQNSCSWRFARHQGRGNPKYLRPKDKSGVQQLRAVCCHTWLVPVSPGEHYKMCMPGPTADLSVNIIQESAFRKASQVILMICQACAAEPCGFLGKSWLTGTTALAAPVTSTDRLTVPERHEPALASERCLGPA